MEVNIKCECCQLIVKIESANIKETHLSKYVNRSGNTFHGFICAKCKQECDNSAFATFETIKKKALESLKNNINNNNQIK